MTHYIETMVTLGFLGVLMWGMLKFMLRDIHKDLNDIKATMVAQGDRIDQQGARIDHLYQICIEMLKEKKQ